jgi:hypothetical protein
MAPRVLVTVKQLSVTYEPKGYLVTTPQPSEQITQNKLVILIRPSVPLPQKGHGNSPTTCGDNSKLFRLTLPRLKGGQ